MIAHFVVWSELIFDGIVHPAFTVLIFDEFFAESKRPLDEPSIDKHARRAWMLLAHLYVHITFVFLVVECARSIISFRLQFCAFVECAYHLLVAMLFQELVMLLDDILDACPLVVVNEVIGLPSLTQIIASGEPIINLHGRIGVQIETLTQP